MLAPLFTGTSSRLCCSTVFQPRPVRVCFVCLVHTVCLPVCTLEVETIVCGLVWQVHFARAMWRLHACYMRSRMLCAPITPGLPLLHLLCSFPRLCDSVRHRGVLSEPRRVVCLSTIICVCCNHSPSLRLKEGHAPYCGHTHAMRSCMLFHAYRGRAPSFCCVCSVSSLRARVTPSVRQRRAARDSTCFLCES